MAESGKRVIVDGVEFHRVWLFPRLLGAITAALQPGRLLIALFMVVALLAAGRLWDRVTEPNVHPGGLVLGRSFDWLGDGAHQRSLAAALDEFARHRLPDGPMDDWDPLNTRTVTRWAYDGYLEQRGNAADDNARARVDAAYAAVMQRIEATRPRGDFEATTAHIADSFRHMLDGVINLNSREVLAGARMLLVETPLSLWRYQTWFAALYGLMFLVVFAVGGGAIARMAAVQQSRDQRLSMQEATDFALKRWAGLIWAQALPLVLLAALGLVIVVIGVFMRVPVLDIVAALAYGLVLLLGFLMAFLLVGYAIGFPLLVPAVACENGDGADAMQRTYAYVVTRPLHALWYWAVGLFGLAIGFIIVGALASLTLNVSGAMFGELAAESASRAAGGYDPVNFQRPATAITGNWHQRWSANIMLAWQSLVVCMVAAYVVSYFFSASTIGYLLMRKASDGQEMDEVWREGLIPGTLAPVPPPVATREASPEP